MNDKIKPVAAALEFNTMMFNNVIKDITDEQAMEVLSGAKNSFNWIAGHLVGSRHFIATLAGVKDEFPYPEYRGGKDHSFDPDQTYPTLNNLAETWKQQTESMLEHFPNMTDELLDADAPFPFPNKENTVANAIGFMLMHESFHLGQLSTYRLNLGLEWKMD